MKVQYFNRKQIPTKEETALNVKYAAFQELLKTSDVVCVNCPLTEDTKGMIGEAEIASMKDGVFLVNTGRGAVVDEKALIKALWAGKIQRAGLDVFDNEPNIKYVPNNIIRYCTSVNTMAVHSLEQMRGVSFSLIWDRSLTLLGKMRIMSAWRTCLSSI
jgi:lactate dehydrogenase-like 2-hydroxyacid dehydrogenase